MRKNKNIFVRNQRRSILKTKSFKQALSLIMILFMCLVLLPVRPIEAVGETFTVYFDASSAPNDEWFTSSNYKLIAHAWKNSSNSTDVDMAKSSKGDNIYECEIPSDYTNILFVKKDTSGTWKVKTPDLTIPSSYTSPCFKYSGKVSNTTNNGAYLVELGTDCWKDLGGTTKPTTSFNSQYIYLDTRAMKANSSYDWNSSSTTHLKLNLSDDKGTLRNADGTVTIDGIEYVYWNANSWDANKKFAIIYDSWDITKGNDYTRTDYTSVNVGSAKGHSFYWDGTSTASIDGKIQYALSKVKPQLNSNYVYLDVTGMKKTEDWTNKGANLYMYVSTLPASENNRLVKANGITTIEGREYVYWDTSKITADTSGNIAFLCEDNWDNADTQDYYRTMNIDETTLETAKGNAYFWNGYDTFEINGVLTYRLDRVDFDSTYESDYSNGDKSIDIPKTTGNKEIVDNAYYASATFYDYYSDYEMKTGENKRNCATTGVSVDDYKNQFQYFNRMIAQYYRNENSIWNPLYFGDFWEQKNQSKWNDEAFNTNWNLYKFDYYKNNSENDSGSAYQGLVDNTLSDGKVTMGNLEVPYFNVSFLRNKTTPLAAIYQNVDFPFTLNDAGYWEFDSAKSEYAVQLKESENDGYYLKRTGEEVKGMTGEGGLTTGFFPFNDKNQSGNVNKLDYGFGMEMEIPFTLTSDGTVKMGDDTKDIEFNFSGDDDIWIFIDGKLVLDIGGDHGRVSGSINFKTQNATVSGVKNSSGNSQGSKTTSFSTLLPKNTYTSEHKMKIFYMERGVWESNMKITFNFPDRNNLEVEKQVIIPKVDPIFSNAMETLKNKNFDFSIKNLVTDSIAYGGEETTIKEKIFNDYSGGGISTVYAVKSNITEKDSKRVISWYAPQEKKPNDGQDVTDKRIVKVSQISKEPLDVSDVVCDGANVTGYLSFSTYQDSSESGTDPFIALVDADGTRIGGWISGISYQNNNNVMGSKIWRTMKVDLNSLKNKELNSGSTAGFDFTKVAEIQFSYWNDVNIYVTPFTFNKATKTTVNDNGFSTDPSQIKEYGSIASKKLSPANGALYSIIGGSLKESQYREVSGGTFGLTDGQTATFRDQFRKGSYIAINEEGVDPKVFDTKWTLYEDGKIISSSNLSKTTANVQQTKNKTTLSNVKETSLSDGRKILNAVLGVEQPDNAIAFYRYDAPDNTKSNINLKALYSNSLKTGSLTIKKSIKAGETVPDKNYTFEVSFSNVAGMALEGTDTIKKTITLNPSGKSEETISGIPAGTSYVIKEIKNGSDEFTLSEIRKDDTDTSISTNLAEYTASGIISSGDKSFEFVNSEFPTVEIKGEKIWEDDNSTHPNIKIRLQRKKENSDDSTYETAKDKDGKDIPDKEVTINNNWEYSYSGLPKYVDYEANLKVKYEYRVVEVKVGDNDVDESGYKPEYSTDDNGNLNITNKRVGTIEITKVELNNESNKLSGAEFTVYKLVKDNDYGTIQIGDDKFKVDANSKKSITTDDNGVVSFKDLEAGFYQIEETKAPEGYVKLNSSFIIELSLDGDSLKVTGDKNDGKVIDSSLNDNNPMSIKLNVLNPKGVSLPLSGLKGIQLYLLIGVLTMLLSAGVYTVVKVRKSKKIS